MAESLGDFLYKIGFKVNDSDIKKVNTTVAGLKSGITKALGVIGIAFSIKGMIQIAENTRAINLSLQNIVGESETLQDVQNKIYNTANKLRISYDATAKSVQTLVNNNSKVFDVDSATAFTENIGMMMKLYGRSESEISSVISSMSTSMRTGRIEAGAVTTMLNQAPELVKVLQERFGLSTQMLIIQAQKGILKVSDLMDAFDEAAKNSEGAYKNLSITISEGYQIAKNNFQKWISETDTGMKLTDTLGKMIIEISNIVISGLSFITKMLQGLSVLFGGTENALRVILATVVAIFAITKANDMIKWVKNFNDGLKLSGELLQKISQKANMSQGALMGMTGVVSGILLLVTDIINFLNGNSSAIGSFLKMIGVDVDGIVEKLKPIKPILIGITVVLGAGAAGWIVYKMAAKSAKVSVDGATASTLAFKTAVAPVVGIISALAVGAVGLASAFGNVAEESSKASKSIAEEWGSDMTINFTKGVNAGKKNIEDATEDIAKAIADRVGFSEPEKGPLSNFHTYAPDMIDLLAKGIVGGKEKVTGAMTSVAGWMKDIIGFSEPKVGPLSDFHTFMPDMIDLMADGIKAGKIKIKNATEGVAEMIIPRFSNKSSYVGNSMTSGGSSGKVEMNVEINNSFTGEKMTQKAASEIMGTSEDEMLKDFAVAVSAI